MTGSAAQNQRATLLDIEELNKNFGGVQAIRDLNLSVKEGEIFGVIGPQWFRKNHIIQRDQRCD